MIDKQLARKEIGVNDHGFFSTMPSPRNDIVNLEGKGVIQDVNPIKQHFEPSKNIGDSSAHDANYLGNESVVLSKKNYPICNSNFRTGSNFREFSELLRRFFQLYTHTIYVLHLP